MLSGTGFSAKNGVKHLMLLDLAIFITLLVIALKASKAIRTQSAIFTEFEQSNVLALLVFLYPAGPIIKILGGAYFPAVMVFGLTTICYIPALVIARKQISVFQVAGTDRVRTSKDALTSVVSGAFIGLIYLSVVLVLTIAFSSYHG